MKPEEIKRMNEWLQSLINLDDQAEGVVITFKEPAPEDFAAQGFDEEVVKLTLGSDWWPEMVTDIVETPEFAEPDDTPEQILGYARDLIFEYVGKRLYPL
jgi:hypothetical protein